MGRNASKVYTEPHDVERIERLVTELPSQARVRVILRNGDEVSGTVTERPAVQLYEDAAGVAGTNAELRLDNPALPGWNAWLWLGDILRVQRLD